MTGEELIANVIERHAVVIWPKIWRCRSGSCGWSFSAQADEIARSRDYAKHLAAEIAAALTQPVPATEESKK